MSFERSLSRRLLRALPSNPVTGLVALTILSAAAVFGAAACADSENAGPSIEDASTSIPSTDGGVSPDGATSDGEAPAVPCAVGNICQVTSPLPSAAIAAIVGRSKSDVWASGSGGALLHWTGSGWTALESSLKDTLTSLFLTSDEMWGTGGTLILHRGLAADSVRVARIKESLPLENDNYRSIAGISVMPNGDVFLGLAAGYYIEGYYTLNYLAQVDPDTAKVTYQPDALNPLSNQARTDVGVRAVHLVPGKALWLVGDRAAVVRYAVSSSNDDAGAPSLDRGVMVPVASQANLRAAWGYGDQLWAVGDSGTILHCDGSSCDIADTKTTSPLNAVFGIAPNDIWAVGENGTALHFDGTLWSSVATGTSGTLRAVWGGASDDVWFGGDAGLFHWGALP
jgi:photosystem II stability/assembly factor-like uncharacterized protein